MGTTIRRQPVTFDMPAAPNYKFLNITNFRGLDVSSNPFELSPNTASDCLNVYVDETNTLTTRPRLEKKIENILPLEGMTLHGAYPLTDGYLAHGTTSGGLTYMVYLRMTDNKIFYVEPTTDVVAGSLTIPTSRCVVFEKDSKVYFIDAKNEKYCYFDRSDVVKLPDDGGEKFYFYDVSGYVPTLNVVNLLKEVVSVEPLNLLSDKYEEKYVWDGINPLPITDSSDIRNESYKKYDFDELTGYELLEYFDDNSFIARKSGSLSENWDVYYGKFNDNFTNVYVEKTGLTVPYRNTQSIAAAKVSKHILIRTDDTVVTLYPFSDNKWQKNAAKEILGIGSNSTQQIHISAKGKFVWADLGTTTPQLRNVAASSTIGLTNRSQYSEVKILVSPDETHIVELGKTTNAAGWNDWSVYLSEIKDDSYVAGSFINAYTTDHNKMGQITADGRYYYNYSDIYSLDYPSYSGNKIYMFDLINKSMRTVEYDDSYEVTTFGNYNDVVYMMGESNNIKSLYMGNISEPNALFNTHIDLQSPGKLYSIIPANSIVALVNNKITPFVWQGVTNATITVTQNITENNKYYTNWTEKRKLLFGTRLHTRFDNNYWFASGNRYYRSANNDPTYFPITEYNDLGDSNEEITGFNLANDTTLIAYKKNGLYLIQPFTSSLDTTEYTITESKNTVGNTAIGAPIVTTLTEIPLQINNDGVYGLSQVSNVSATERIADLMSGPINERWLDIPDNFITNAKTLNRLYWTYIIIPREDLSKTTVYLLDNRTNSWYYWEFPIIVTDAFVKDNVTELVDKFGAIYRLTSTDIINKSFTTQLVTEYYDDGRLIIPWYWQSQVMYLGTMNYSKRLVNTTFILTDTDSQDGYGLNYNFKVFRKLASSTPEKELSGDLTLVRSTTKKTNISKFGFVQLKLSNITEESQGTEPEKAFRNNKLRLVGLGLKYVLLEGLIR